ncbi:MAG: OmpA family protein, partial [Flavobacteriales bacterium]|nr:OmpA family protein [Flavobacteriales bacterium]
EIVEIVEEPIVEPVPMEKPVEKPIVTAPIPTISNIYFDNNRFFIRNDASSTLDQLAIILTNSSDLKLAIHGHADNTHHASNNMTLSNNRAKEAKKYLTNKGISSSRITISKFGEHQPEDNCLDCTETQLQSNRRVEFKLSR